MGSNVFDIKTGKPIDLGSDAEKQEIKRRQAELSNLFDYLKESCMALVEELPNLDSSCVSLVLRREGDRPVVIQNMGALVAVEAMQFACEQILDKSFGSEALDDGDD